MKKITRLFSFVLAVMMLAGLFTTTASALVYEHWYPTGWAVTCTEDGVMTIKRDSTGEHTGNLYLEHYYYENYPFSGKIYPTEIFIPEGVESLNINNSNDYTFPSRAEVVHLPQSLTHLGRNALAWQYVSSFDLPNGLAYIGDRAFSGSRALTQLTIPDSVTYVGYEAFTHCELLTSIVIPESVTYLGGSLFRWCYGLTSVTLPSHITSIPCSTFDNCSSLTYFDIPDGVTVIEDGAFTNSGISYIEFPDGLLCIDHYAFQNTQLSSIELPDGLEAIGIEAFAGTALTAVVIPESVTYIGEGAFPSGEQFTVYGYRNTHAQWFAEGNGNTFVPLDECDIKISVKDENVLSYDVACGTVMDNQAQSLPLYAMYLNLTVTPDNDTFSDVSLDLKLPEGFSFEPDELVTEKSVYVGAVTREQDIITPAIYPIYLDGASENSVYKLTARISGVDSVGQQESGVDNPIFFTPLTATTSAANTGSYLNGVSYEFSTASALGSGTSYNKGTAEFSVLLSAAAYEPEALRQLLTELGFSEIICSNGTYGYTLAHKRVIADGEIKTLVCVVCRGTNELGEWWGDVNAGSGEEHQRYLRAAVSLDTSLYNYCEDNGILNSQPDDRYLLLTGYSKGAGVANILANRINNLWHGELFSKETTSVYTFATPNVSTTAVEESDALEGNENVFNFVHYQDLFLNTPSMLSYGRYGTTRIFGMRNDAGFGHYKLLGEEYDAYRMLTGTSGTMFPAPTFWYYTTEIEVLSARLMTQDPRSDPAYFLMSAKIISTLRLACASGGNLAGLLELSEASTAHDIYQCYLAVINDAPSASRDEVIDTLLYVNEQYGVNHALDVSPQEATRFKCPVNVYVEDLDGSVIAYIENGAALSESPDVSVWIVDDTKYVSVSENHCEDYIIRVEPYDYGTMTHSIIKETDDGLEFATRERIPLVPGESYYVSPCGLISLDGESDEDADKRYVTSADEQEFVSSAEREELNFTDVSVSDWFHDTVYAAANAELVAGYEDGTYRPENRLSWAQTVTFAVRLAQYTAGEHVYTADDQTEVWYEIYVNYALEHGIIGSVPDAPNAYITRGDAAPIFAAVLGDADTVNDVPEDYFTDVSSNDPAYDAIYALARAGICNGTGAGVFGVNSYFLRSEVSTIVARTAGLVSPAKLVR